MESKVHYCLSELAKCSSHTFFFFKSHLSLSSDLSPDLSSSDRFRFPDENFVGLSLMHAACPANLIFIDSVILLLGEEYKL